MIDVKRKTLVALIAAAAILTLWLFTGVFRDREWSDPHVFLKHRPTFKVAFCSPRGEADPCAIPGHEGFLTPEQEKEEQAYIEFIEVHGGYRRSFP